MNTAERIYNASTSEGAADAPLAERIARRIEDDMATRNLPAGGVMGSLRELSERYAVGRAAVREAVALLERRGLGRLRPGPCGGFIVAQSDAGAVGAALAEYFRTVGITRRQLEDAREAVDLAAAGLAAVTPVDADEIATLPDPTHAASPLEWHLGLRSTITGLCGEPVLGVFAACLNDLTLEFAGADGPGDDWRETASIRLETIRRALSHGDADAVSEAVAQVHADLIEWLAPDADQLPLPTLAAARQADDRTLATVVARKLAHEIVHTCNPGQRLGSEWDLCERFSVSRATLRQAIRQLQDSGLVECRRGRGNGLIVRDLQGTGSIRMVLAFLISHQMDPRSAGTILFQLNRYIPALAIGRASKKERARIEELLAVVRRTDQIERYDLLRLVQYVSQVAESPIIDLYSRCLAAYEARFHPFLAERLPTRIQTEYFDLLRLLLDRVGPGDEKQLAWAKDQSARVMLMMSRDRPL